MASDDERVGAPDPASSHDRLVEAASRLLARQGYEATVVKDIARLGAAPMGSFYYHFPGGKEELAAAGLRWGADRVAHVYARVLDSHDDAADALAAVALEVADDMEQSVWREGCPVATVALESVDRTPALRQAASEAFTGWQRLIAARLERGGCPPPAAKRLAVVALALLEGAEMLARVHGSREPLERAADALRTLARASGAQAG